MTVIPHNSISRMENTEYAKQIMAEAIEGGVIESNGDNAFFPAMPYNPFEIASGWGDLAINATLSAYLSHSVQNSAYCSGSQEPQLVGQNGYFPKPLCPNQQFCLVH